jgi:hypothetical protein
VTKKIFSFSRHEAERKKKLSEKDQKAKRSVRQWLLESAKRDVEADIGQCPSKESGRQQCFVP